MVSSWGSDPSLPPRRLVVHLPAYSLLNASTGSTPVARQAGSQLARSKAPAPRTRPPESRGTGAARRGRPAGPSSAGRRTWPRIDRAERLARRPGQPRRIAPPPDRHPLHRSRGLAPIPMASVARQPGGPAPSMRPGQPAPATASRSPASPGRSHSPPRTSHEVTGWFRAPAPAPPRPRSTRFEVPRGGSAAPRPRALHRARAAARSRTDPGSPSTRSRRRSRCRPAAPATEAGRTDSGVAAAICTRGLAAD